MYKIKSKTKIIEVMTLDDAMKSAKEMNELVTIKGDAIEIVGLFGVDFVVEGKCPDGSDYTWKKRRR
jgi:hypothetical protein